MASPTWDKTARRHLRVIADTPDAVPFLHLSENKKTGYSINVPVHATCAPTTACRAYCYSLRSYMAFDAHVRRSTQNLRALEEAARNPVRARALAEGLAGQLRVVAHRSVLGRPFLRWNGDGDLTHGAVVVLNELLAQAPWLDVWVITRKPKEAAQLADQANLRLLLSLDATTPPKQAQKLRALIGTFQKAAVRLAWVQQGDGGVPDDVHVVFNEHSGGAFRVWNHAKVCHATQPGDHTGACAKCARCFQPKEGSS